MAIFFFPCKKALTSVVTFAHICIDLVIFTAFPSIQLLPILKFWQICITVLWFNMFLENIHVHIGFYFGLYMNVCARANVQLKRQIKTLKRHTSAITICSVDAQSGSKMPWHTMSLFCWCIKSGNKMPWHTVIVLLMHTEWK